MKTHTKILAAFGAMACVAISLGQAYSSAGQARDKKGGVEYATTADGQRYRALKDTVGGFQAEPLNAVQRVLSYHLINVQNHLIEKHGDDQVTAKVILGHCESQLTLRTPQQQKHEIYDVWDIDLWTPGPQWEALVGTPSLADAILRIDPKVEKEIAAFEDRVSDEFMKPMRDFIKREGLAGLPKEEAQRRLQEWSASQYAGVTMVERSRRAVERSQRVLDFARTRLNAEQRAEMDRILRLFDEKMANVAK
jgi:hypothetical protein